jgi:hypothetical protein
MMNMENFGPGDTDNEFDFADLDLGELTVTSMRNVAQPAAKGAAGRSCSCSCCTWQNLTK